jgi:hypothetical protein
MSLAVKRAILTKNLSEKTIRYNIGSGKTYSRLRKQQTVAVKACSSKQVVEVRHKERIENGHRQFDVAEMARTVEGNKTACRATVVHKNKICQKKE